MKVTDLPLAGLKLIEPRVHADARGYFLESYQEQRYVDAGIDCRFVQDNHSRSIRAVVRGLHYQSEPGQAKLVRVVAGRVFDVAVDIRPGSRTFGQWYGIWLDDREHAQLFIPVGFAHGFCAVSDFADVLYKVSTPYDASTERGIRCDDPALGVEWPVDEPILSERDRAAESFEDYRRRVGA